MASKLSIVFSNNPLLKYPLLSEAAAVEFSTAAYEQASINNIIEKSDISKGSIYHHFGDKFGLFLSIVDIALSALGKYFAGITTDLGIINNLSVILNVMCLFAKNEVEAYAVLKRLFDSDELCGRVFEYIPFDGMQKLENMFASGGLKHPSETCFYLFKLVLLNLDRQQIASNTDVVMGIIKNGI